MQPNRYHASLASRRLAPAFTIIELVVVIAIIGLLMGAAAFTLPQILGGAKVSQTKNDLQTVEGALQLYYTQKGQYPDNRDVYALVTPSGSLDKPSAVQDAWGNDYVLLTPSEFNGQPVDYLLYSFGPNRIDEFGAGDDIVLAQGYDIVGPER